MSFRFASLVIIVLLSISAFAQTKQEIKAAMAADATKSCFATFNNALPNFCVTQNGNIEQFFFPAGVSQIFTDGYGICDFTTAETSYYDDGDQDSGNWLNPTVSEPNGANTFPLTITRTTSDGIWTIKQAFSRNTADAYVKVVITWTNNTAVGRVAFFTRYVDIDADNFGGDNWFDGSTDSGWGYSPASAGNSHGLTVRSNQSNNNLLGFATSFSILQGGNHDPCHFIPNPTPFQADQAVMYLWSPGSGSDTVPAHGKVTQTLEFRPM
jgi:hypothetical protein